MQNGKGSNGEQKKTTVKGKELMEQQVETKANLLLDLGKRSPLPLCMCILLLLHALSTTSN